MRPTRFVLRSLLLSSLLGPLLASCGALSSTSIPEGRALVSTEPVPGPRVEGELEVQPGHRERPSLRSSLPYSNGATMLGYGGVQLWARPERDEVRVGAIIDAPTKEARWQGCTHAILDLDAEDLDAERIEVPATYIGAPMEGGVYDAVRIDLRIDQLRRMAGARRIRGLVCGDSLELGAPQRRTIGSFVDWFDRIAEPSQNEDGPGFREVGPVLDRLPNEDPDLGLHPA